MAFTDALAVGRDGRPTQQAIEAWQWLAEKTDWVRYGKPAPPPEIRPEFYGSFDWACSWLGEDPDRVRNAGLPPIPARVIIVDGRRPRDHVRGLPDVKRRWEIKASGRY